MLSSVTAVHWLRVVSALVSTILFVHYFCYGATLHKIVTTLLFTWQFEKLARVFVVSLLNEEVICLEIFYMCLTLMPMVGKPKFSYLGIANHAHVLDMFGPNAHVSACPHFGSLYLVLIALKGDYNHLFLLHRRVINLCNYCR